MTPAELSAVEVAQSFAEQDRLDPDRPTLAALVQQAVEVAEERGAAVLRARIEATAVQRETLAAERETWGRRHLDGGNVNGAAAELRWAASLRDQASALRSVLS